MSSDKDLLKAVEKWVARVGRNEAMAVLMKKGVGTSTAHRLVSGRYAASPSNMLRTTLTEILQPAERAS